MKCRNCNISLKHEFLDLGCTPLSNGYLKSYKEIDSEKYYALKVLICQNCWLVQTDDKVEFDKIFNKNYAYFSSFSKSWLSHSSDFVDNVIKKFNLDSSSLVIEIASNDGYLLQYFKKKLIPCFGIEPTGNTAAAAKKKGIHTIKDFFSTLLARNLKKENKSADLIIANNVLAHVPKIKDFVKGFAVLLKANGVASFEFPHVYNLIKKIQFDTVYHEHFSYLSLTSVNNVFNRCGLRIIDVERIITHGGSLRVYAQKKTTGKRKTNSRVKALLDFESKQGIDDIDLYLKFQKKADKIVKNLNIFLNQAKLKQKKVIAYGAAAKGNTLLNYAKVKNDIIKYVVDSNPAKQDHFMPGSGIPIVSDKNIRRDKPDYILILPWNLKDEIKSNLGYIRSWGGKFVTAIPKLDIS